jgi:hypothetical protein
VQVILFKIDTYLPLDVSNKCPFIYTGPNFAPFQVGLLPGVLQHRGITIQRFYPLTVYYEETSTRIYNQLFAFCFLYLSNDQELVFYITPICWLRDSDHDDALNFFLTQISDLAHELTANSIILEVNYDITPAVAFPTSLSPFSYDLQNPMALDIDEQRLLAHDFQIIRQIHGYEQTLIPEKLRPTPPRDYTFREVPASQNHEVTPMIAQLHHRAFALSSLNSESSMHSEHLNQFQILALKKQGWFKKPELTGYLQWTPNLFEPSREYHIPVPLIFQYAYDEYPFTRGKIHDWGFNAITPNVISPLLDHAATSMKKHRITHLQIGGVLEKSPLQSYLVSENFTQVHTIHLLQKNVN